MENVILIVLLTAAVAVGIWYTIRHFKGEGGCCGGGRAEAGLRRSQNPGDPVTGLFHPLFDLSVVHWLGV